MRSIKRRGATLLAGFLLSAGATGVALTGFANAETSVELPTVEERLPKNPLIVTPTERPGKQGGTWNHALVGGGSLSMLIRYQGYDPIVRINTEWTQVIPNVAESYEVSPDSTVYTFKLREGHK